MSCVPGRPQAPRELHRGRDRIRGRRDATVLTQHQTGNRRSLDVLSPALVIAPQPAGRFASAAIDGADAHQALAQTIVRTGLSFDFIVDALPRARRTSALNSSISCATLVKAYRYSRPCMGR